MKKILAILIALLLPGIALAAITTVPWRYDTTANVLYQYPATTTRVGIGTTSPVSQLSVVGQQTILGTSTQNLGLNILGNTNDYYALNIQNLNLGNSVSSDLVAIANNGGDFAHYIDMGINGGNGAVAPFLAANDTYLYSYEDPLNIGALGTTSSIKFFASGGVSSPLEILRITPTGLAIATTTQGSAKLNLAGNMRIATTSANALQITDQYGTQSLNVDNSSSSPQTNILQLYGTSTTNAVATWDQFGSMFLKDISGATTFSVTNSSSSAQTHILQVGATSSANILFDVDAYGHMAASSTGSVTLSSCGTSPTFSTTTNEVYGTVTPGATANGCTITFQNSRAAVPICTVTERTQSLINALSYTVSVNSLTLTQTGLSSVFDYNCLGQ